MKYYTVIFILFFQLTLVSCQEKENLYLFFKPEKNKMYLEPFQNHIFTYSVKCNNTYRKIYFDSKVTLYEEKKENKKEINFNQLKNINLRGYKWLEKTYTPFKELYDIYDKMYIVQK